MWREPFLHGRRPLTGLPSSHLEAGIQLPIQGSETPASPPAGPAAAKNQLPSPTQGRRRQKEAQPPGERTKKGKRGARFWRAGREEMARPAGGRSEDASSCGQLFPEGASGRGRSTAGASQWSRAGVPRGARGRPRRAQGSARPGGARRALGGEPGRPPSAPRRPRAGARGESRLLGRLRTRALDRGRRAMGGWGGPQRGDPQQAHPLPRPAASGFPICRE